MAGKQVSRLSCGASTIILATIFSPLTASTATAQSRGMVVAAESRAIEARLVTLHVKEGMLVDVLHAISQQAGLTPAYNEAMLPKTARVTMNVERVTVIDAFQEALRGTGFVAQLRNPATVLIVQGASDKGEGIIAGTIGDATTKAPIQGVTVTIDGTKLSARTDERGTFRIGGVPVGSHTLVLRRIGYRVERQTVRVTDSETSNANLTLTVMATPLEQVVTTVTGPQRRLELGNAIGVIKADSLMKDAPITSLSQLLTGRVPGLIVSQGQGTVGGNTSLQIRGQTSLALSNQPIVIVDGVRYSSRSASDDFGVESVSPLNDLNPNDVERVEIVKGPSAATLYGTDASNGVVVITTKRGNVGPPRWTAFVKRMTDEVPRDNEGFSGGDQWFGWGRLFGTFPINFCSIRFVAAGYCTIDSVTHTANSLRNKSTSILQPAQSWGYGATVSGGQQALRYYFSGNFDDLTGAISIPDSLVQVILKQRGVKSLPDEFLHPNDQGLLNLRSNVTASLGPKLDLTISSGYTHGKTRSIDANFNPYRKSLEGSDPSAVSNSILNYFARQSTESNNRFVTSANGQARMTNWWTARGTIGLDAASRERDEVSPRDSARHDWYPLGIVSQSRTRQVAVTGEGGMTVTLQRGIASFRTSLGAQYVRTMADVLAGSGSDLPPGGTSITGARFTTSSDSYEETVTLGSYLEETVGFNERLFLTGALRIDGAGSFGTGYKAATYPKVSASWLLSDEPFMPQIRFLDQVRLRAALGVAGRQPTNGMALPSYKLFALPQITTGISNGSVINIQSLGNPSVRPERGREFEGGIDAGFLDRRLQLEQTWYRRSTTDQLVFQKLPAGFDGAYTNIGLTTEHGTETQLSATVFDTRPISLGFTLQYTTRATKLMHLGNAKALLSADGGYAEGYPLGARFVVPIVSFHDANNDHILVLNEIQLGDSVVFMGQNTAPRAQTLAANLGLFAQRLRFSALFDRQSGVTQINDARCGSLRCREAYDSTTPLAQQATFMARFVPTPGLPGYRYVESGSFTRLREVTAAVTLPERMTRLLRVSAGSVSLSARNLALWSRFSGPDPESVPVISTGGGVKTNTPTGIPLTRTWSLRCDLSL